MRRAGELIVEEACVVYAVLTLHAIGARGGGHPTCGKVRCGTLAYKIHLEQAFLWEKILTRVHVQTSSRVKEVSTTERAAAGAGGRHNRCIRQSSIRANARPPAGPGARGDDRPIEVSSASGDPLSAPRPTHGVLRARRALSLFHARTRHGRRIAASGYCEVLPACCGKELAVWLSPAILAASHPRGGGDPRENTVGSDKRARRRTPSASRGALAARGGTGRCAHDAVRA